MERTETSVRASSGRAREIRGIRWLRVLLLGLAAEVALMVVAVPTYMLPDPQRVLDVVIGPASFVVLVIFGYWAARPVPRLRALHGLLTGAVGVLLYLGLILAASFIPGAPEGAFTGSLTPSYLLAHGLKLLGGWTGGMLAARRARPI